MTEVTKDELTFDDLDSSQQMIVEDTGCALEDAYKIEDILRNEVFNSTLDWQSRAEFRRGARKAWKLYQEDRAFYEEFFAENKRRYQEFLKDQPETTTPTQQERTTP